MKLHQLRIGNLIYTKMGVSRIEQIIEGYVLVYPADAVGVFSAAEDECDGIEVISDWLQIFGFIMINIQIHGSQVYKSPVGSGRIFMNKFKKNWTWAINSTKDPYNLLDFTEFQYFHQLQNIYFASTGEELKINHNL